MYSLPNRPASIVTARVLKNNLQAFEMPVTHIVVGGNTTSDGRLFHFRLLLINDNSSTREGRTVVRLDIRPSCTDPNNLTRGVLLVDYLVEDDSDSPETSFATLVRSGTTAGEICEYLINDLKMDLFDFTPEGTGCRRWCATALDRLASVGIIQDDDITKMFGEYEEREAAKWGAKIPMPSPEGTFYTE